MIGKREIGTCRCARSLPSALVARAPETTRRTRICLIANPLPVTSPSDAKTTPVRCPQAAINPPETSLSERERDRRRSPTPMPASAMAREGAGSDV
jgi:hypothetical protein